MTAAWEKAAEDGNVLAAADLAAQALARAPDDPDIALAALVYQSNAGRYEEAFDIFQRRPSIAQDPKGFVALILDIASAGALELVERYNLYPAMEQVLRWHPALAELSVRIAAQFLARDPSHVPSLKHLEAVFTVAANSKDVGLAGRLLMACPEALRPTVNRGLAGALGGLPDEMLPTLARLEEREVEAFLDQAEALPFQEVFPRGSVVWRMGTGTGVMAVENIPEKGAGPVLDAARLAEGVERLRDQAAVYLATGPDPRAQAFREFASSGMSPILIVSTGRVGTRAMELLLNGSRELAPFHSLAFHVENGDHNSILYRMLAGEDAPGGFAREIEATLTYRLSEFAYCHAKGWTPVIVNHLDTVLLPIYLAAFPNARVIRMHRDPGKTLRSLAYKNQFGFRQLRHLITTLDEGGESFLYRRDTRLSIEQECAWYMHVTDMLADAYAARLVVPGRFLDLDMERAFTRDETVLSNLAEFLDDPGITSEGCRAVFSERVNEKAHYTVDDAKGDPARLGEIARHWSGILERDGAFPAA